MTKDDFRLEPCPECSHSEPTKADCKECFDQAYEKGDITDDDIREVFGKLIININKELGLEDELLFIEYEESEEQ